MATRTITVHDRCTVEGCGKALMSISEGERGTCGSCDVKNWRPEKKAAIARLIASAFNGSSDQQKDAAVDAAFEEIRKEKKDGR